MNVLIISVWQYSNSFLFHSVSVLILWNDSKVF